MKHYPLLDLRITTPRLELCAASDELLDTLSELVYEGKADAEPPPYDDPISFYEPDPDVRVTTWLRKVWLRRAQVDRHSWRLNFAVVVDGQAVGEQAVTGIDFADLGTVTTFSWLSADERGRGLGREMREAVLHLAFAGLDAMEANSDAFLDNVGSNSVSERIGYEPNGFDWATRRGEPAQLQRWRLTRERWQPGRRGDIELHGVEACRSWLPLTPK